MTSNAHHDPDLPPVDILDRIPLTEFQNARPKKYLVPVTDPASSAEIIARELAYARMFNTSQKRKKSMWFEEWRGYGQTSAPLRTSRSSKLVAEFVKRGGNTFAEEAARSALRKLRKAYEKYLSLTQMIA